MALSLNAHCLCHKPVWCTRSQGTRWGLVRTAQADGSHAPVSSNTGGCGLPHIPVSQIDRAAQPTPELNLHKGAGTGVQGTSIGL